MLVEADVHEGGEHLAHAASTCHGQRGDQVMDVTLARQYLMAVPLIAAVNLIYEDKTRLKRQAYLSVAILSNGVSSPMGKWPSVLKIR